MNLSQAKKILIIRLSSLGDILLTTPLIRSVKKTYTGIQIDFLLRERYASLLKHNPYISDLIFYKEKVNSLISENNYDLIIDLQNNLRTKKLLRGVETRIVRFPKRSFDKFLLVNFKINRLKEAPPVPERYAEVLEEINPDTEGLDLFTDRIPSAVPEGNYNFIGFAPGARHFTKRWPKEYFAELGRLLNNSGFRIILLGGKEDKPLCNELTEMIDGAINLCTDDDILQIAADMKLCKAIICNDSGLMHAACAVKIPVITFFGSTVKEFGFTPYRNRSLVLENKLLSCRPCSHIGRSRCPKRHFKCMLEITPAAAYNNLTDLLSR